MSVNVTAIIAATYLTDATRQHFMHSVFNRQQFHAIPGIEKHAGGANTWSPKTSSVWAAEFDHVSMDEVVAWFKRIPWKQYDVATLTIHHESDDVMVAVAMNGVVGLLIDRPTDIYGAGKPVVLDQGEWRHG